MEISWLSIKNNCMKEIIVGIVYRPPQGNVRDFVTSLSEMVHGIRLLVKNSELFLIGDFNVNYLDKRSEDMKLLNEVVTELSLSQLITQPTRYGRVLWYYGHMVLKNRKPQSKDI